MFNGRFTITTLLRRTQNRFWTAPLSILYRRDSYKISFIVISIVVIVIVIVIVIDLIVVIIVIVVVVVIVIVVVVVLVVPSYAA